jgi:hypothetical protein
MDAQAMRGLVNAIPRVLLLASVVQIVAVRAGLLLDAFVSGKE